MNTPNDPRDPAASPVSTSTPLGDLRPKEIAQDLGGWFWAGLGLCVAAGAAGAYHGYKRNGASPDQGSKTWGVIWGLGSFVFPPVLLSAAIDGYARPSDSVLLRRFVGATRPDLLLAMHESEPGAAEYRHAVETGREEGASALRQYGPVEIAVWGQKQGEESDKCAAADDDLGAARHAAAYLVVEEYLRRHGRDLDREASLAQRGYPHL